MLRSVLQIAVSTLVWVVALGSVLEQAPLRAQDPVPPAGATQPGAPEPGAPEQPRVFVPLEELDHVIRRDRQGVLLSTDKLQELVDLANAKSPPLPQGTVPFVLQNASYAARLADDQLLITATLSIRQYAPGWHAIPLRCGGLSVESARMGDAPARIGRIDAEQLLLLTNEPGTHTLTLQLSQSLSNVGSDQLAAFRITALPTAELTLELPAQKFLQWSGLPLERPAAADQPATYKLAVGGQSEVLLRITDRPTEQSADGLVFAHSSLGLNVTPAEVTWRALTNLQVFGRPIDQFEFRVPEALQIVAIKSAGLESWEFGEQGPQDGQHVLRLRYRQPITGNRDVEFQGLLIAPAGESWTVPTLSCLNVASHTAQIIIHAPPGVRVQVDEAVGVTRQSVAQPAGAAAPQILQYNGWRADFILRLTTQPKAREISAAIATILDVRSNTVQLESSMTLETRFAPLFEVVLKLPADWNITQVRVRDAAVDWEVTPEEAGWNILRLPIQPPVPAGQSVPIVLSAQRQPEGWPIAEAAVAIELPEVQLTQAQLVEGTYLVTSEPELDLETQDLRGLDPTVTTASAQNNARLNYQYQDVRYGGQLTVTRKPSLIASRTLAFHRLERDVARSYLEATLDIHGGGVRRLVLAVAGSSSPNLRWTLRHEGGAVIVEQTVADGPAGTKLHTLVFDQRLTGVFTLMTNVQQPRDAKTPWSVPLLQVTGSARETGHIVFEAEHDQELTLTATTATGIPLEDIDPADLPTPQAYAPRERIVAAFGHVLPGYKLDVKEQRFDRLAVPTAICDKLSLASILGETGEFQHSATYQFRAVGVQSVRVTLPAEAELWATLLDQQPIEVRKTADAYLVPLTSATGATDLRQLKLFYRTQLGSLQASGQLTQVPPQITVLNGDGTEQPLEVLQRDWTLHAPAGTQIIDSLGDFQTDHPLRFNSFLGHLIGEFQVDSPWYLFGKLCGILVLIGLLAAIRWAFVNYGAVTGCGILITLVISTFLLRIPAEHSAAPASATTTTARTEVGSKMSFMGDFETASPPPTAAPAAEMPLVKADLDQLDRLQQLDDKPAADMDLESRVTDTRRFRSSRDNAPPAKPGTALQFTPPAEQPQAGNPQPTRESAMTLAAPATRPAAAEPAQPAAPAPAPNRPNDPVPADGFGAAQSGTALFGRGLASTAGAVLSLTLQLDPPTDSVARTFTYTGRGLTSQPRLEVTYLNRSRLVFITLLVQMLVVALWWWTRLRTASVRGLLLILGWGLPLGLSTLAPATWLPLLDALLSGTTWGLGLWILWFGLRTMFRSTMLSPQTAHRAAFWLLATCLWSSTALFAQETVPVKPAPLPQPAHPQALVVPYDLNQPFDAQQAQQVLLPWEQFKALYERAHPEVAATAPAPVAGEIAEALYTAELLPAENNIASRISVTGRLVYHIHHKGQVQLPLPLGPVALQQVQLNGTAAPLVPVVGDAAATTPLAIVFDQPGLQIVDVQFTLAIKQTGPAGSWSLPLAPVPAGTLTFRGPDEQIAYRLNGSSQGFRRSAADNGQTQLLIPVSAGGQLTLSWRPQQQMVDVEAFIQADSFTGVMMTDTGLQLRMTQQFTVRQGSFTEMVFALPEPLAIRTIAGEDVGGWQIAGAGTERTLTLFFRRKIEQSTSVTLDAILQQPADDLETTYPIPDFAPRSVARETGRIVVFAGPQFGLRLGTINGLQQIEPGAAGWQAALGDGFQTGGEALLAFRFTRRPIAWELIVQRRQPKLALNTQHAVFVTPRKLEQLTQFQFDLKGAPRSELLLLLPQGYLPQDIQSEHVVDWHISGRDNPDEMTAEALLHLQLDTPRIGLVEIRLLGRTSRDANAPQAQILLPYGLDAEESTTAALVMLDSLYTGQVNDIADWKSIDPSWLTSKFQNRAARIGDFAFQTDSAAPEPIALTITRVQPRLTASATNVLTVQNESLDYLLALQWNINAAAADTFTFTTPGWIAEHLEFPADNGPRRRSVTRTPAGEGLVRWTITLESPIHEHYFLAGIATLPPSSTGEVAAPAVIFEQPSGTDEGFSPLETQSHFVVLVNRSQTQLSRQPTPQIEGVRPEDLVQNIKLRQDLLQEAAEMLRLQAPGTPLAWKQQTFQSEQSVAAAVNLARHLTILAADGTWREKVQYRIKNRSRQFLALRLPPDSQLLSVIVKGQPTRAVQSPRARDITLIPLPKTVTGDVSFDVELILAGRLPGPTLAQNWGLWARTIDIPAPVVIAPEQDAAYGIPVAQSTWTVMFPQDQDAWFIHDSQRTNVTSATADIHDLETAAATLSEVSELININSSSGNRRAQAYALSNLKQLQDSLSLYDQNYNYHSQNYREAPAAGDASKRVELGRRAAELNESVTKLLQSNEQKNGLQITQDAAGNSIVLDRKLATGQSQLLGEVLTDNGTRVLTEDTTTRFDNVLPQLSAAPSKKSEAKSGEQNNFNRALLREKVRSQLEAQSEKRQDIAEEFSDQSGQSHAESEDLFRGRAAGRYVIQNQQPNGPNSGSGTLPQQRGAINFNALPVEGLGINGALGNIGGPGGGMGGIGGGMGGGGLDGADQPNPFFDAQAALSVAGWNAAGGLSLPINIPEVGQAWHFNKVGGNPKVALAFRPHQMLQRVLGAAWTLIWGLLILVLLRIARNFTSKAWLNCAPWTLVGLGVCLFCLTRSGSDWNVISIMILIPSVIWAIFGSPFASTTRTTTPTP